MAMKARYTVVNGEIISETRGAMRRTYVPDANGNTVALLNESAAVTDTISYWPYGEVKTRTGSTPTPFQFGGTAGYYSDSANRLYVRSRYYANSLSSWLSVDGFWPKEPAYSAVHNNPTTLTDPSDPYLLLTDRGWKRLALNDLTQSGVILGSADYLGGRAVIRLRPTE